MCPNTPATRQTDYARAPREASLKGLRVARPLEAGLDGHEHAETCRGTGTQEHDNRLRQAC